MTYEEIPKEVIKLAANYTSPHIDGWAKEIYKKQLKEIKKFITKVLEAEKRKK